MKTTKEKIEVMKAFERGEQIQYALIDSENWGDVTEPKWNWYLLDYRVKPKLVPYESEQEFYEAVKAHGGYIRCIGRNYSLSFPTAISIDEVWIDGCRICYEELLKEYEFVDGTPCGKEEQQ